MRLKLPSVAMLIEKSIKHLTHVFKIKRLTHVFNRKVSWNMKGPVLAAGAATCSDFVVTVALLMHRDCA
jgi:hypothetical protein